MTKHGYGGDVELLWCDNGSTDERVIPYMHSLAPTYARCNKTNMGCAKMHNQMMLRAKGDLLVFLDDDTELQQNWLLDMVETYEAVAPFIENGVAGIHSLLDLHEPKALGDVVIHPALPPKEDAVFCTRMLDRQVIKKVGYFCEDYGPYGLVDNEYTSRVHHSGFTNYYIGSQRAEHLGWDICDGTEYRRMKDESMRAAGPIFLANMKRYFDTQDFYVPPPALS